MLPDRRGPLTGDQEREWERYREAVQEYLRSPSPVTAAVREEARRRFYEVFVGAG